MISLRITENQKFLLVAAITLIAMNFWSFRLLNDSVYSLLEVGACGVLVAVVVYNLNIFFKPGLRFNAIVLFFLFLPLLSVIGAYAFHQQPIGLSLMILRLNLFWLLYFVLHIFNISTEKILKLILFIGCVWAFLTTVQQFTYPKAYFFTRGEGNASLVRANILRFMPEGQFFGVFMLIYFFYQYLLSKKLVNLIFVGLGLCGIYYYGTRQGTVAAVACMLAAVMFLKGVNKWVYLLLFFALAFVTVVVVQPTMITHYINLTSDQMDNEDYVRFRAIDFFLNDYWPNGVAKLIGNGKPHMDSPYGVELNYFSSAFGYWRADIGIVGVYNTFGIFYVLNCIWVNIKGTFPRIPADKDKYLRLLFIFPALLLTLNAVYGQASGMCFFCLVYYLTDKALQENKITEFSLQKKMARQQLAEATV